MTIERAKVFWDFCRKTKIGGKIVVLRLSAVRRR